MLETHNYMHLYLQHLVDTVIQSDFFFFKYVSNCGLRALLWGPALVAWWGWDLNPVFQVAVQYLTDLTTTSHIMQYAI